jgi:hypothetical protein
VLQHAGILLGVAAAWTGRTAVGIAAGAAFAAALTLYLADLLAVFRERRNRRPGAAAWLTVLAPLWIVVGAVLGATAVAAGWATGGMLTAVALAYGWWAGIVTGVPAENRAVRHLGVLVAPRPGPHDTARAAAYGRGRGRSRCRSRRPWRLRPPCWGVCSVGSPWSRPDWPARRPSWRPWPRALPSAASRPSGPVGPSEPLDRPNRARGRVRHRRWSGRMRAGRPAERSCQPREARHSARGVRRLCGPTALGDGLRRPRAFAFGELRVAVPVAQPSVVGCRHVLFRGRVRGHGGGLSRRRNDAGAAPRHG